MFFDINQHLIPLINFTAGVSTDGLIRHFFHRPSKAYTTGTRKRRKVHTDADGSETRWHKTGKTRPVYISGKLKGYKKILVLYTNYKRQRKPEKTNWVMHQYHLGNNEEEKEGELVVSKVFYQTQPRQCSSLMKDSSFPAKLKDQSVHEVTNHKNNGFVEYYNTSFISFDQGDQHRSSNAQLISHFPVHDGAPFIPWKKLWRRGGKVRGLEEMEEMLNSTYNSGALQLYSAMKNKLMTNYS